MTERRHLLAPAGVALLRRIVEQRPVLGLDFDGTLAPIVARPDLARMSMAVARRLSSLSAKLPVAVVSGRAVDDLHRRIGFRPRWLIGNHGAEQATLPADESLVRALDPLRQRLAAHAPRLQAAGVTVEDKRLSIAVHYRCASQPDAAAALVAPLLSDPTAGTRVFGGKRVFNVVSVRAPDKADAMLRLAAESRRSTAIYIGDDENDEPVFRRAPAGWLTVRVGRDVPASAAGWFLDGTGEVGLVLDLIMSALSDSTA